MQTKRHGRNQKNGCTENEKKWINEEIVAFYKNGEL
jgi:hypothetical protein